MPAAPRTSNKIRNVAYGIMGVPGALQDDLKKPSKPKKSKTDGHLKIETNNSDSKQP
jgi:hypothetical protein